jgi:lysylphosphatidylglycerol synthetase-like protein (DUF2156 family)
MLVPMRRLEPANFATALTAAAGVGALLSAVPAFETRLAAADPLAGVVAHHLGHTGSAVAGLFLLQLASQLRRRRHRAWQLTVGLLLIALLASASQELDWSLVVPLLPLVLLVLGRHRFTAPSDPPSLFRLLAFAPLWALAVLVFGLGSLWLERAHLDPPFSLGGSLSTVASALVGGEGAYRYESPHFQHVFEDTLLALSLAGAGAALWLGCRPLVQRPRHGADDWARAQGLVEAWGDDTLSYFAMRRDKSFFYASDGGALIAYGWFAGYALASGDPIGRPESIRRVIAEFVSMCRARGWGIGFLAVREDTLPLYEAHSLRGVYLGDEAILECKGFQLEGSEMRPVRLPVNKLRKRGYRFEWVDESEADPATLQRLREIAALHHEGEHEHGFTMALGEPVTGSHRGLRLAIARNEEGRAEGFLRFVPCFGGEPGLSLDLMRRDPAAPNGITEYLIAESAFAAREHGISRLSLNFAAYGRLLEADLPLTPVERVLRALVLKTDPLFQTRSLWSFNRKFQPTWLPRALVYENTATFPRVALSYVIAEGFVRLPWIGPLLVAQPVDRVG